MSAASALALGFVLGLKHAGDADHVAAVSTLVSERSGLVRSSLVGALWGLGHSLALLPIAIVVIFMRLEIDQRVAAALELGVAVMLIGLALSTLYALVRGATLHGHVHQHGERRHRHLHLHAPAEPIGPTRARAAHHHAPHPIGFRPLVVGLMHGVAGSAALMLLVLSTIPGPALALVYVAVFAVGSTLGMVLVSLLLGVPLRLAGMRAGRLDVAMRGLAGCFSLVVGLLMIYQLAFAAA